MVLLESSLTISASDEDKLKPRSAIVEFYVDFTNSKVIKHVGGIPIWSWLEDVVEADAFETRYIWQDVETVGCGTGPKRTVVLTEKKLDGVAARKGNDNLPTLESVNRGSSKWGIQVLEALLQHNGRQMTLRRHIRNDGITLRMALDINSTSATSWLQGGRAREGSSSAQGHLAWHKVKQHQVLMVDPNYHPNSKISKLGIQQVC
ncbi:hypothetical protein C8J56DRAFT_896903 [Mycena floridula]|nr:hypothetical protein C8J56DRAFT_896903 [Mycena floridula]